MSGANKNSDVSGSIPTLAWFVAALLPMVISQIVRLQQTDAGLWVACDYAGRVGALAVLAIIPAARAIAFQKSRLAISSWEVAAWILATVFVDRLLDGVISKAFGPALANTRIATYPVTTGWLYVIDIAFGLALVAVSEEILFRRCARHVLTIASRQWRCDGYCFSAAVWRVSLVDRNWQHHIRHANRGDAHGILHAIEGTLACRDGALRH